MFVHTSQTKVHFLVILESEEIQDSEIPEPRISHFQNLSQPCLCCRSKERLFQIQLGPGKKWRKLFDKLEVFPIRVEQKLHKSKPNQDKQINFHASLQCHRHPFWPKDWNVLFHFKWQRTLHDVSFIIFCLFVTFLCS